MMRQRNLPGLSLAAVLVMSLALAACGPNLEQFSAHNGLYLNAIALTGPESGWAAGLLPGQEHSILLREMDGNWQPDAAQPPTQAGDTFKAIAVTGATVWLAGAHTDAAHGDATHIDGFVLTRTGDGAWQRQDFGAAINAIAFPAPGDGWAVGNGGAIYHFTGAAWAQVTNPMANDLLGLAFRAPNDGWAVGELGAFAHWDGIAWRHQEHFTHVNVAAVALAADDGWAVGDDGTTFRLGPDGWFSVATPMNVTNHAVAIVAGNVWVAGEHGSFFERTPDGAWNHIAPPADAQLNALAVTGGGDVWVGGNFDARVIYELRAGAWNPVSVALATSNPA